MVKSTLFVLTFILTQSIAHTWLDCVKDVGTGLNTGVQDCRGFARGYPGRVGGVDIDRVMTYRIQPRVDGQNPPICATNQRSSNQYTNTYYMTKAQPGERLRMRWTPNGHQRGAGQDPLTWSIHWTSQPNTQLANRLDLNNNNKLTGPVQFDQECFCNNCAGNPCYGYFTIPADTKPGIYSFIWYWVFNRDPSGGGEEYTTCFDVNVGGVAVVNPPTSQQQQLPQQTSQANNVIPTSRANNSPQVSSEVPCKQDCESACVDFGGVQSCNCSSPIIVVCGVSEGNLIGISTLVGFIIMWFLF